MKLSSINNTTMYNVNPIKPSQSNVIIIINTVSQISTNTSQKQVVVENEELLL